MGWASGSTLFYRIIEASKGRMTDFEVRKSFYKDLILTFECEDWDTQDECLGEDAAYDAAINELHPEWYDD